LLDLPLGTAILSVVLLLALSGFFSGSETGLMSLNRYRLRHLAQSGHKGARFAIWLLERPDKLIGLVLLLNNVAQALIPMLLLVIAQKLIQDPEIAVIAATVATALSIFIFAESMPKTLGAINPERIAIPAAYIYAPLVRVFQPLLTGVSFFSNSLLRLIGISTQDMRSHSLSIEELRTVVAEAGALVPQRPQQMLLGILDLENMTVNDIMVPRQEIAAIDINDSWDDILNQLRQTPHTRLPVYQGELDKIIGLLHMKRVAQELVHGSLTPEKFIEIARSREPYFVPEGTALNVQLTHFQRNRRRLAFVVNEYGNIEGLVTLEDLLEEIVGEFTSDPATVLHKDIHLERNGIYIINASATIRAVNRALQWQLPTDGPKTLNGLLLERLETIPEPGTALRVDMCQFEIIQVADNTIKTVRAQKLPPTPQSPDSPQ
jgi:Mg2+/Co2+ transporter CorB